MKSKLLSWVGLAACITLIISCFLPWAYFADSHIANEAGRTFTGFYSYQQNYGRPGKFLSLCAAVIFVFMILPKVWAKRTNLFLSALAFAYAVKTYILFTSCYNAYCPEKRTGIFIMLISAGLMLLASVFPDMKIVEDKNKTVTE